MSTLFQTWIAMTLGQKVLAGVGGVFATFGTYAIYYRISEKSKAFNGYTTSDEAMNGMNLTDKYAIVTGSNTGIGKQTVKTLYKHGCNVIMACRNIDAANTARSDIINCIEASTGIIDVIELDLSSLESVRDFASKYTQKYKTINYLINNAGIMALPSYKQSKEGYELQFAVNHIGHFYLTHLLIPRIIQNKARIITLSSTAHRRTDYKTFDKFLNKATRNNDGPSKENYDPWINYGISKTCNILFARELHKRYNKDGVTACSVHPGMVIGSDLSRNVRPKLSEIPSMLKMFTNIPFILDNNKSIDQGAATTLRCISLRNDELRGGHYYHNCQSGRDGEKLCGAAQIRQYDDYERDSIETRLWRLSETLIQQKGFDLKLYDSL